MRLLATTIAIAALVVPAVHAQTESKPAAGPPAAIKSFRLVQEKDGPAIEILSTRPLVPAIQLIDSPPRLVIDLPNAVLDTAQRKFRINANQISGLRGDQFQTNPAVARIVIDLLAPRKYTWDAAGNRLVVHLGKNPSAPNESPFQAPTMASITPAPAPAVASVETSGPLAIAQDSVAPGAAVTAAAETAVVALSRGGDVYVCPNTSLSLTPSQNGHNVMLGMNRGALETHFALDASSDSILTPDFRILLPGPGEFHFAVSVDSQGNTCMRALPGNTASAIVSELIGDRTYQVRATDQLMFHLGRLDQVDRSVPRDCGCSSPKRQAKPQIVSNVPAASEMPVGAERIPGNERASAAVPKDEAASSPDKKDVPAPSNEVHVQVTEPLVFRATGPPPKSSTDAQVTPPESPSTTAPAVSAPVPQELQPAAKSAPVTTANPPARKSFFRKLGGFFAAIFR